MVTIESMETVFEENSLWVNLKVFSSEDTKDYIQFVITLSGKENNIVSLNEYIEKGENDIEFMIPLYVPAFWYPNGTGPTDFYEIKAEAVFGEETSEIRKFIHSGQIEYTDNNLKVYDFYPQIFGLSVSMANPLLIEKAAKAGFNCIFTNDSRQEIKDYCVIKGLLLLPFEMPNCNAEDIPKFRKTGKKIILSSDCIDDDLNVRKYFEPIYVGNDFIANNTNNYIGGTLSLGYLNPVSGSCDIISEEKITVREFETVSYTGMPKEKEKEIAFANLWMGKNIIAKNIVYGKNTSFKKADIMLSKFQIDENTWEILFTSKDFVPNLNIITENQISDNNFSIFPGETVCITFFNISGEPEFSLKTL